MTGIRDQRQSRPGAGRPAPSLRLIRHRSGHVRLLLLALLPPLALTQAVWSEGGLVRETLEWLGYVAVVVCVLGRAWCSAYVAGRKTRELVDRGPYSVVRNPLYAFSLVGLTGIGLQTGSLTWAALLLLGGCLYYRGVVRREESRLLQALPAEYQRYRARTPRWLPDVRLWRDVGEVTIRPALVARTLLDSAAFFAAWPVLEALGVAHAARLLPSLLSLP
jgi:protein-S-isoprenylcysteine O-methyltransferase Ste14